MKRNLEEIISGPLYWSITSRVHFASTYAQCFVVQSLSHVQLFATQWTASCQASLSFTISRNLLKLMSFESVMPSNHLILCCPLLLPQSFPASGSFPKNQLFASDGQSNGASASASVHISGNESSSKSFLSVHMVILSVLNMC